MRIDKKNTAIIILGIGFMGFLCNKQALGETTWEQTDWSGGAGQTDWVDDTKYDTGFNVDVLTSPGDVILSTITETVFWDDMEVDESSWTAAGLWHREASGEYAESHSPTNAWWFGDHNTGNYANGISTGRLSSISIDLTNYDKATLSFWYWYRTETTETNVDKRWIQVYDGTWNNEKQLSGDTMETWHYKEINLDTYAGNSVQIGFYFDTVDQFLNNYRGWYIDDVKVTGSKYPTTGDRYLISSTYDTGSDKCGYGQISWSGNEPAGTDIKFQIAASTDNITWPSYAGPDGSGTTYYSWAQAIYSGWSNHRYIKYKAYLETTNPANTPTVYWVRIKYNIPPETPTNLTPLAGGWAGANPKFGWSEFSDPDTTDTQASFQVQCTTISGNYTYAGVRDSGEIGSTANEYQSGWSLSSDFTHYWRVRVKDDSGYANSEWSEYSAETDFQIDTSSPTMSSWVNDSLDTDIDWTNSTIQLSANWAPATDDQTGIAKYWIAIGTFPGGTSIKNWTDVGLVSSATVTGLSLTNRWTYFFGVKAENGVGLKGEPKYSDGITVDATAPAGLATVRDGTGTDIDATNSASQLSVNWDSATDSQSGLKCYWYGIGTTAGDTDVVDWTNNELSTSVTHTDLTLTEGVTYYFTVKAENIAGGTTVTNSDGEVVDLTVPVIKAVYSPNTETGTSSTVENQATDNVYSIANDSWVVVRITLAENEGSLTSWGAAVLADCFILNTSEITGGPAVSGDKTVTYKGGNEFEIKWSTDTSTVSDGEKKFKIKVKDAAGNEIATYDETFVIYLDQTNPAATKISPSAGSWLGPNGPLIQWQASTDIHISTYAIIIGTTPYLANVLDKPTTSFKAKQFGLITNTYLPTTWDGGTLTLTDGTSYWWTVGAEDLAGNYTIPDGWQFYYDSEAPIIQCGVPTSTQTKSSPSISAKIFDYYLSGIDTTTIVMKINNEPVTPTFVNGDTVTITYTPPYGLADSTYTVKVDAKDICGNSADTLSWNFKIDTTPPEVKDSDNDGYSDLCETNAGTNPNDPNSKPIGAGGGILLVDDDTGDPYEIYYQNALDAGGFTCDTWDVNTSGSPDAATLSLYNIVIWLTGDDYTSTLTATDRTNLQTYLDGGGKLFITGQDIGYDIAGTDPAFYGNYLHANYVTDNTGDTTLDGVGGDPITDGISITISGAGGANNQNWPSQISPGAGATEIFYYAPGVAGAIRWNNGHKVVYFSFGFEAINNAGDRKTVMQNVMNWLGLAGAGLERDFYPMDGVVVNYDNFVTAKQSKIKLRIDDPHLKNVVPSGIALAISTVTITGQAGTFTFDSAHLPKVSVDSGEDYNVFTCQLPIALKADGLDDGTYTIKIYPQDNGGKKGGEFTRTFVYDNIRPTITVMNAPAPGNTEDPVTFNLTVTDANGLSLTAAVQMVFTDGPTLAGKAYPLSYNMVNQGENIYALEFVSPSKEAGTYKYYFTATDKAGNTAVYPENADTDPNLCLTLTISDVTLPAVQISKIETLVGFNYTGLDPVYNTSAELNSIPTVYSYDNNILEATAESGTTEVVFQYKLSTSPVADFQDLTTLQTETLTVWRSTWNTTALPVDVNYDIRAKAKDAYGNWNIPQDAFSDGWVEVNLKPTLAPSVKIDTTTNTSRLDINKIVYGKNLVVNALRHGIDDGEPGNIDFAEVRFEYKKIEESEWHLISTDSDASSAETKDVVFRLDEADIPLIQAMYGVDCIGEIQQVKIDFKAGTTYDRIMVSSAGVWSATVPLPPNAEHDYQFEITHKISGSLSTDSVRDPHEYGNSAEYSRIVINPFSCVFAISGLESGKTYQLRAFAKDSQGNEDQNPEILSFTYDSSKPSAPVLIEPVENARVQAEDGIGANETFQLTAEVSEQDVAAVIFEISDEHQTNWKRLTNDIDGSDGWVQTKQADSVINDTVKYLRAFAVDKAGNISSPSSLTKIIVDATAPEITEFSIVRATTSVTFENDKEYLAAVKTVDKDVKKVVFSNSGISGNWSPSATITKFTGSGSESDPYVYSATFKPTDLDSASGQITGTIEDTAIDTNDNTGNQSPKSIDVTVKDVTVSVAKITTVAGQSVDGPLIYVKASAATVLATVDPVDGGIVKFQYAHQESSNTWVQFAEVKVVDFPPGFAWADWDTVALALPEGDYYLRTVCIDNDANVDPSPEIVLVRVNNIEPEIREFTVDGSTANIVLDSGKEYLFRLVTKSTDIKNVVFTAPSGSWDPASTITAYAIEGGSRVYEAKYTSDLADTVEDQTLQATLTDIANNSVVNTITGVKIKDVTPSMVKITEIDGLVVISGEVMQVGPEYVKLKAVLDENDQGIVSFELNNGTTGWQKIADIAVGATTVTTNWNPCDPGYALTSGQNVLLRAVSTDDDDNVHISPEVTVIYDNNLPAIGPASIISVDSANGKVNCITVDEYVDEVRFEYRQAGSTDSWRVLGTDDSATPFGSAGKEWVDGTSDINLSSLPAGNYEIRAIARYSAENAEASSLETPVYYVEIKINASGTKIYLLEPEERVALSVSNATLSTEYAGTENTFTGTLNITSTQTLSNVRARLLLNTGASRYLPVSGSGGSWSVGLDLSDLLTGGGSGKLMVTAVDSSGKKVTAEKEIGLASASKSPTVIVGRVANMNWPASWGDTNELEHECAMAVFPAPEPSAPSHQRDLVKPVGEPWNFLLSDPEAFSQREAKEEDLNMHYQYCEITLSYSDRELKGADETKIGIAFWEEEGRWSSRGITDVTRDLVNNRVTFNTNHFSRFSLAIIDSKPQIKFISPLPDGYASSAPFIEVDLSDSFSAIKGIKVELDGVDQTNWFDNIAYRDGIDNDGNGVIDEGLLQGDTGREMPLNQVSATSAKYKLKAPLHLSEGEHTLTFTATNEQGQSASRSIKFLTSDTLQDIKGKAWNCPNPFDPTEKATKIKVDLTKDANVTLKIYDFAGSLVSEPEAWQDKHCDGGRVEIEWRAQDKETRKYLANGVYFARVEVDDGVKHYYDIVKIAVLR